MKREKLNVLNERDLLIGLITSDKICREICPILEPRLLEIEYTRIVATWIKDFYDNFKKPPKQDIIKIYRARCNEISDEDLQDNVLTFIKKIDSDYDEMKNFNDEFVLKQSIDYLKCRSLKNLSEDISAFLTTGDITKAENAVTKYSTVEKNSGRTVSLLHNTEALINAFTQENDLLFEFPGAYGKVIGKVHREDFISFLAPMKRGKTHALVDAGITALRNSLKVLHVSLEMSESQVIKRYWTSLSGQLNESKENIEVPYFIDNENGSEKHFEIDYKTISRKAVVIGDIERKQKNLNRLFRGGDIRIFAVPAYSLSVEYLNIELDRLSQQENFIPDVVIIDYADIMLPSGGGKDYRNQLDSIWKKLRGLAQERKCVVFTASQSSRSALKKDADSVDIAEDIRKLAHITSMVAINQSDEEKQKGIVRFHQLAIRDGEQEFRDAVCTQCLTIGRMIIDSRFSTEVMIKESKKK